MLRSIGRTLGDNCGGQELNMVLVMNPLAATTDKEMMHVVHSALQQLIGETINHMIPSQPQQNAVPLCS